jgi:hypothetical protein
MAQGDRRDPLGGTRVAARLLTWVLAAMLLPPTRLDRTDVKRQAPQVCHYPLPTIYTGLGLVLVALSAVSFTCWGQPAAGIDLIGIAVLSTFLGYAITRSRLWASKWRQDPLPYLALPGWLLLLFGLAGLGGLVGGLIAALTAQEWVGGIAVAAIGLMLLTALWAALSFRSFTAKIGQAAPAGFPFPGLDLKCQAAAVVLGGLGLLAWMWSEPWAIVAGTALAVLGLLVAWWGRAVNRIAAQAPDTQVCAAVDGVGIATVVGKMLVVFLLFWVVFLLVCEGDEEDEKVGDPPPPTLVSSDTTSPPQVIQETTPPTTVPPTDPAPPPSTTSSTTTTTTTTTTLAVPDDLARCSALVKVSPEELEQGLADLDVTQQQSGPTPLPPDGMLDLIGWTLVPVDYDETDIEEVLGPVTGDPQAGGYQVVVVKSEGDAGIENNRYQSGVYTSTESDIEDPQPGQVDGLERIPTATKAWFWDAFEDSLSAFDLPRFDQSATAAFAYRCGRYAVFGIPSGEVTAPWLWFQEFARNTPPNQSPAATDPAGYSLTPARATG